jgi:small subunit ribosomal protein S1
MASAWEGIQQGDENEVTVQADVNAHLEAQQRLMASLILSDYDYTRPRRREIREATVLVVQEDRIVVDLGVKRDGVVTYRDLERLSDEYRSSLQVGDQVPVYVLDTSDAHGEIVVSLNKGLAQQDWLRAQELLESQENCEGEVTAVNRGGIVVRFGRLQGFVPGSHLTSIPRGLRGERLQQAKSALVGQVLTLAVIEVNPRRRRLILSERKAQQRQRQQLLEALTEGDVRTGTVRNLVSFGAFVDLGGIDGLIHISELDWKHVNHPKEVLSVGDQVEVYVLRVDRARERIGLSRKRLLPDPWSVVTAGLNQGDVVEGVVTHIAEFGAFVDLGEGVEGLVHVSEMPDGRQTKANLGPGSSVYVQVLRVDPHRHRISLSLRIFPHPVGGSG